VLSNIFWYVTTEDSPIAVSPVAIAKIHSTSRSPVISSRYNAVMQQIIFIDKSIISKEISIIIMFLLLRKTPAIPIANKHMYIKR
jgi:hypothetical protein